MADRVLRLVTFDIAETEAAIAEARKGAASKAELLTCEAASYFVAVWNGGEIETPDGRRFNLDTIGWRRG